MNRSGNKAILRKDGLSWIVILKGGVTNVWLRTTDELTANLGFDHVEAGKTPESFVIPNYTRV